MARPIFYRNAAAAPANRNERSAVIPRGRARKTFQQPRDPALMLQFLKIFMLSR